MVKKRKLSFREILRAFGKVAVRSFKMAPAVAVTRILDSIVQALLPIATTYYAAQTTTALTNAYAGVDGAAGDAMQYVVITAILGIVAMIWGTVSSYINQKMSYIIEARIEDEMMLQFSRLPFALYDDKDTVDVYEKASRFSRYFSYIFDTIGGIVTAILSAIGSIVALLFVTPVLGIVVLLAVLPGAFVQLRLSRQQMHHWEGNITTRRRRYNINYTLQQPRYIAEMRVYGVVKHLVDIHAALRDKDEKERIQFELKAAWKKLFASVGESLVELGALLWITLQIIAHNQPVGQFLFVQQMVGRALGDAGSLANRLGKIDEDLANLVDYQHFMELSTEPEKPVRITEAPQVITFDDVSFVYPKTKKHVLSHISLAIKKGQRIAIVGENGAGKSTLIKLAMGLYRPTSGTVFADGVDLNDVNAESWHRHISLLGQEFVTYDFATMYENITLGNVARQPTDEAVNKAVHDAEFTSVVQGQPHGLDTFTERWMAVDNDETSATELSGGQRQRLALARNFFRDSPIVILDEPTSAIDALAESRIFARLFKKRDKTMIIVSHRVTTIKKADVIYVMKDGAIVEQGSYSELVVRRGEFYRMFESQLEP